METPHPEYYVDYLNLLQNTGHQLEDIACFNHIVVRAKCSSYRDVTIGILPLRTRGRREKVQALPIPNLQTQRHGLSDGKKRHLPKRIKR